MKKKIGKRKKVQNRRKLKCEYILPEPNEAAYLNALLFSLTEI